MHCNIREDKSGLRLRFYSKDFVLMLKSYNLPCNKQKCQNIFIPTEITQNNHLFIPCIRGITDTDGSLFFANKGYRNDYPTIEISTISEILANQLYFLLTDKLKFKIGFRNYKQGSFQRIYRISINGDKMLNKWIKTIGFSNPRNLLKYQKYINKKVGPEGFEPSTTRSSVSPKI